MVSKEQSLDASESQYRTTVEQNSSVNEISPSLLSCCHPKRSAKVPFTLDFPSKSIWAGLRQAVKGRSPALGHNSRKQYVLLVVKPGGGFFCCTELSAVTPLMSLALFLRIQYVEQYDSFGEHSSNSSSAHPIPSPSLRTYLLCSRHYLHGGSGNPLTALSCRFLYWR